MKDKQTVSREDITSLLGRTASSGVLSVYVGLSSVERHDPGRWLSAVRSGLTEVSHRHPGEKSLARIIETAQQEIGQLPPEGAPTQPSLYFRESRPGLVVPPQPAPVPA